MNRKKRLAFIWAGLILILLNFTTWILTKGGDDSIIAQQGIKQYYVEMFLWLVLLNVPAVIVLIIGFFGRDKSDEQNIVQEKQEEIANIKRSKNKEKSK